MVKSPSALYFRSNNEGLQMQVFEGLFFKRLGIYLIQNSCQGTVLPIKMHFFKCLYQYWRDSILKSMKRNIVMPQDENFGWFEEPILELLWYDL